MTETVPEETSGRRKSSRLRESNTKQQEEAPKTKRRKTQDKTQEPQKEPEPELEPEPTPSFHAKLVILPSKIVDGQQLPTLPEPQEDKLASEEWQSVAERY